MGFTRVVEAGTGNFSQKSYILLRDSIPGRDLHKPDKKAVHLMEALEYCIFSVGQIPGVCGVVNEFSYFLPLFIEHGTEKECFLFVSLYFLQEGVAGKADKHRHILISRKYNNWGKIGRAYGISTF